MRSNNSFAAAREDEGVDQAADVVRALLDHAFTGVRWLLEDVSDEEIRWEPLAPCWSVRRRPESASGWGRGDWVVEDQWPPPEPLPVTTIAWRIAHLAAWTDIYRNWTFDDQSLGLRDFEVPGDAAGLVSWLVEAQDRFRAAVAPLADGDLRELRPAHYGPMLPVARLVTGMVVEHTHHGAEIGLLRDLRRGHARVQPPPIKEEP